MSYNVTSTIVLRNNAYMEAGDVLYLSSTLEDDLPEICFLEDMLEEAQDAFDEKDMTRPIDLPSLDWAGLGSGHGLVDVLLKRIAPRIRGRIDAVMIFEGSDLKGITIANGVGSLPAVKLSLNHSKTEWFD